MKHPASRALCAVVLCLLLCSSALLAATPPSASELSPGWREKEGSTLLRFDGDRVFLFSDGQLQIASVTQRRPGTLVLRRNGLTEVWKLSLESGSLRVETLGKPRIFERLPEAPPELAVVPFRPGEARNLPQERIHEITSELQRRYALDQEPRRGLMKNGKDEKLLARLQEVDADNRRYIRELLADVGWIDSERFGKGAVAAATIMIKHHEDLAVQMAVLPLVERQFSREGGSAEPYVVLFDGLRIDLGQPQRFGSQIGEDFLGTPCVLDLEDPVKVDDFRKEAGLVPLGEYLAQVSQLIFGGRPVQLQCGQPPIESPQEP
jgi:hypothetical protein